MCKHSLHIFPLVLFQIILSHNISIIFPYSDTLLDTQVILMYKAECLNSFQTAQAFEDFKKKASTKIDETATKIDEASTKIDDVSIKLDEIKEQMTDLIKKDQHNNPPSATKDNVEWDQWLRFSEQVSNFDTREFSFFLIIDKHFETREYLYILQRIKWRVILDLDPESEKNGFYKAFQIGNNQSCLVSLLTPSFVEKQSTISLYHSLDMKKIQWLFLHEQTHDELEFGEIDFDNWREKYPKHISRLFSLWSEEDNIDNMKTIICLIVGIQPENSGLFHMIISRLRENFKNNHRLQFVAVKFQNCLDLSKKENIVQFVLTPKMLFTGIKQIFAGSSRPYRLPSHVHGISTELKQQDYLYLAEYLDVLYLACEDIEAGVPLSSTEQSEEEKIEIKQLEDGHRQSFLSGNWISFVSLYYEHDASRKIEEDIRVHMQRLLDKSLRHSMIVEIRHPPGTGGSTIARRVLWNLHQYYPCAIVSAKTVSDGGDETVQALCDCISTIEVECEAPPVILIDGRHSMVVYLSNRLVRLLNSKGRRVVLLRCVHGVASSSHTNDPISCIHRTFNVDGKLEQNPSDLRAFENKYRDKIECVKMNPTRVFLFPLLAMLSRFQERLKEIVEDSLREMSAVEQEIAGLVAFIQIYADHPTPALLIWDAFGQSLPIDKTSRAAKTYRSIQTTFSENLLNLMVKTQTERKKHKGSFTDDVIENYTLQHIMVAKLVRDVTLKNAHRNLHQYTELFLTFPIFNEREEFKSLHSDLFLRNKQGDPNLKFSVLFEELKREDSKRAAEIFALVASKMNDPTFYSNAARFHAKKLPPSFEMADKLLDKAFELADQTKQARRSIYETQGIVRYIKLRSAIRSKKVKSLEKLESSAELAISSFMNARDFPIKWPNPLIGEVSVWLTCIEWIVKRQCSGDSRAALEFITNRAPEFFRKCISHCFHLLDIVDNIVGSVETPYLHDPQETKRLANESRLTLWKNFVSDGYSKVSKSYPVDLLQECQYLCSQKNFPLATRVELLRLQAHFLLTSLRDQKEELQPKESKYLVQILDELVFNEGDNRFSKHLLQVSLSTGNPSKFSLDYGIRITDKWLEVDPYDCMPYFYRMAIFFLKVLDGNVIEYMGHFCEAQRLCKEKSNDHCRRTMQQLYVGSNGQGLSRLLTRSRLMQGEAYNTADSDNVVEFWMTGSRRKLLDCEGRIHVIASRKKKLYNIELKQGNINLHVGNRVALGMPGKDFPNRSYVKFVVSFNLEGPVANGVKFSDVSESQ